MFNLNESNHYLLSVHSTDMRVGVNTMSGKVVSAVLSPTSGDVYIFVGKSRRIMKLLQ